MEYNKIIAGVILILISLLSNNDIKIVLIITEALLLIGAALIYQEINKPIRKNKWYLLGNKKVKGAIFIVLISYFYQLLMAGTNGYNYSSTVWTIIGLLKIYYGISIVKYVVNGIAGDLKILGCEKNSKVIKRYCDVCVKSIYSLLSVFLLAMVFNKYIPSGVLLILAATSMIFSIIIMLNVVITGCNLIIKLLKCKKILDNDLLAIRINKIAKKKKVIIN